MPRQNHDRAIEVKLTADALVVKYQLEIDEYRAVQDLPKEELARIRDPQAIARVFLEHAAPILRNNLIARLDKRELSFQGTGEIDATVTDHLRCNFTFTARWKPAPDQPHVLTFREANYDDEDFDRIDLTLGAGPGVHIRSSTQPDAALRQRAPLERKPGDVERLRNVSATFVLSSSSPGKADDSAAPQVPKAEPDVPAEPPHSQKLLHLLLDTRHGFVVLLLLAAGFGAAHALTPGHGKTLVAAYLVGKHGTVWHALMLGLMTTLTHTGAVIVLAVVFLVSPSSAYAFSYFQGLLGGLLIVCLGLWLLVQRLFGRPDHVHLGGHGHHHHHHHHHDHDHDHDHSHEPPVGDGTSVRWWHLLFLGFRGGLVPCWDAILLLCLAISAQRLWLGLPLLLAFSVGLAGVLVGLGVSVVWARNWVAARWGGGQRLRSVMNVLPLVSAAIITAMGLWLCYNSLHPEEPPSMQSEAPRTQ